MPRVGIELTTPVFEQAKTVHALDRAAILMGTDHKLVEHKHEYKHN
jgi:hypothetical protein